MTPSPDAAKPTGGLRERKKARTRNAIQRHALRLFGEQGYQATTVEQVAEAAEVAPSTVFRYFPTKEDLLVLDGYHSLFTRVAQVFEEQPAALTPVQALRATFRQAFADMRPAERSARRERDEFLVTVPELLTANFGLIDEGLKAVGGLVAARVGRSPDDPEVRALVGAVLGVAISAFLHSAGNSGSDPSAALDEGLARLEDGFAFSER